MLSNEPVLSAAGITAAATAILQVLFLWHVIPLDANPDAAAAQQAALTGAVSAIVGLVAAWWARNRVSPI